MKKIILFVSAALLSLGVDAQVKVPQPSPLSKIEQVVGLTDVAIEYSRPSMKGRTIFGNLVPYDKLWRTGANKNTQITFGDDVKVGGAELKKGTYAIFTKPGKENWEVMFYSDANNWGTPREWDDSKVAAKITVKSTKIPMNVETFTIMLSDFTMDSAHINILWENTEAAIKLEVPSKKKAAESIELVMAGPSHNDHYQAATFYKETGDLDKAKAHIEKAVAGRADAFWYHRQHSLILAKSGDKAGAIKAAKTSLELAEKAKNADYVKLNKDSLAEWGAK
ncbi:DUF2911 domain-containing protein [Aquimarina sp. MMG015]|uniref:DUF2911 domain-containing protein n=1 Tax=Aquimarina TaxID=290174 RepID=UPI0003F9FF8F|nr:MULTISPECIES: DUF2911 domain-containing protein [Aquimarina]AXT55480.1 DUF2911 domain-containing protein [Aquimarina sp. AD1]MBQ4802458.1 DUF2911 domain-containing protein [Aquimarina sp. MMG015]RKN35987.1 DUF2911 domain-containing protein [Aquimarina sp. AD1]